jgi:hypothetical protein
VTHQIKDLIDAELRYIQRGLPKVPRTITQEGFYKTPFHLLPDERKRELLTRKMKRPRKLEL